MNLSLWLGANNSALVNAAVIRLSEDEILKSQVTESVEMFFSALSQSAAIHDSEPLNTVLSKWVEARSALTDAESVSLVPLLATLKEVIWGTILKLCSLEQAIELLTVIDVIFTDAMIYLSRVESVSLLNEMRSQLDKARAHVNRLDRSKSNFIAVAAHELRTPLTLIEGYTDMMARSALLLHDPQMPLLLEGVSSGTKRLRDIINDLLDAAMLDLNLMELHFQPVWLRQVLNAAERSVGKLLVNRQLELIIDHVTIPHVPIVADPDRLLQVMQKILTNAVKYTPDGGKVVVQGRELPGFTDIMVIDNGIGILPSNLPHIFDTFSALGDASLHSSGKTKFKGGGPGLGLPIAKGIVEAHGGTIWAESDGYSEETYPGSTFHIMIPMQPVVLDHQENQGVP